MLNGYLRSNHALVGTTMISITWDPSPSRPPFAEPHMKSSPTVETAPLCEAPQDTDLIFRFPGNLTSSGVNEYCLYSFPTIPTPNFPLHADPQVYNLPSESIAALCEWEHEIWRRFKSCTNMRKRQQ
ncbi:unnamed protein product [Phytophthora fragariaefolia]|uniref:Unnamed protein product n=1 Tax=Phytophthora fragariaefolia TaxID=1490495 RepID=A0A9W7CX11_9STRA|nr:unnamed protein product [Phytophthora fragariaefolia]